MNELSTVGPIPAMLGTCFILGINGIFDTADCTYGLPPLSNFILIDACCHPWWIRNRKFELSIVSQSWCSFET